MAFDPIDDDAQLKNPVYDAVLAHLWLSSQAAGMVAANRQRGHA